MTTNFGKGSERWLISVNVLNVIWRTTFSSLKRAERFIKIKILYARLIFETEEIRVVLAKIAFSFLEDVLFANAYRELREGVRTMTWPRPAQRARSCRRPWKRPRAAEAGRQRTRAALPAWTYSLESVWRDLRDLLLSALLQAREILIAISWS